MRSPKNLLDIQSLPLLMLLSRVARNTTEQIFSVVLQREIDT